MTPDVTLQQFYPYFLLIASSLALLFLGNVWFAVLPVIKNQKDIKDKKLDLAHIFPMGAILVFLIMAILILTGVKYDEGSLQWIRTSLSGINNILFLLALPYYKHAPFSFIERFSLKKWRKGVICTGVFLITTSIILRYGFTTAAADYIDLLYSVGTLILLTASFFINLWRRNLKLIACLSIILMLVYIIRQAIEFNMLDWKEGTLFSLLAGYVGFTSLIMILIAMGFGWLIEEISITVPLSMEINILSAENNHVRIQYKVPQKVDTVIVEHKKRQSELMLRFAYFIKSGEETLIKRNYLNAVDLGDFTNVDVFSGRIINEINDELEKSGLIRSLIKADIFNKNADSFYLRCPPENISINYQDKGVLAILEAQKAKVYENNKLA